MCLRPLLDPAETDVLDPTPLIIHLDLLQKVLGIGHRSQMRGAVEEMNGLLFAVAMEASQANDAAVVIRMPFAEVIARVIEYDPSLEWQKHEVGDPIWRRFRRIAASNGLVLLKNCVSDFSTSHKCVTFTVWQVCEETSALKPHSSNQVGPSLGSPTWSALVRTANSVDVGLPAVRAIGNSS